MTTNELLEKFRSMVAAEGREGAKKFLVQHFAELPEDVQGDILVELLIDAGRENELQNLATDVREAALDALDEIDAAEAELKKFAENGANQ